MFSSCSARLFLDWRCAHVPRSIFLQVSPRCRARQAYEHELEASHVVLLICDARIQHPGSVSALYVEVMHRQHVIRICTRLQHPRRRLHVNAPSEDLLCIQLQGRIWRGWGRHGRGGATRRCRINHARRLFTERAPASLFSLTGGTLRRATQNIFSTIFKPQYGYGTSIPSIELFV